MVENSNRMQKLFLIFTVFIFLFITISGTYSHGKKDIQTITPENFNNWQEQFPLYSTKKVKYNILIKATDYAGNTQLGGPYNLYSDPESNLPVTTIINPSPMMQVNGNLNIVGSCQDDDSVESVEIVLDKDAEKTYTAQGKEFWSYYLDTTELQEGLHTLTVTGTDINGVRGHSVSVKWMLNRKIPVTKVGSVEMGQLVSGTLRLQGEVQDGNGIKALEYSLNDTGLFLPIKLSSKKDKAFFTLSLDTKKLKDGPCIVWFRAHDTQGSVGIYTHLLFIDNTAPDLVIVSPEPKETQCGTFSVIGRAKDSVELASIEWSFLKEKGVIPIVPGNPYWAVPFNTTEMKERNASFTVTVTDTAGNKTKKTLNIALNQELSRPQIEVLYPLSNAYIDTHKTLFIRGVASSLVDRVKEVQYKIDNGPFVSADSHGVFCLDIAEPDTLTAGRHTVTVQALSNNGAVSLPLTLPFIAQGMDPGFTPPSLQVGKTSIPVTDGMSVNKEDGGIYTIQAISSEGIKEVKALIISGKVTEERSFGSSANVSIPIDASFPEGVVRIVCSVEDKTSRIVTYKNILKVLPLNEIESKRQEVVFNDSSISEEGVVTLSPGQSLTGYFCGGEIKAASLTPPTSAIKLKVQGSSFILTPDLSFNGSTGKVQVVVTTTEGLTFLSRPLFFSFDLRTPKLVVETSSEENSSSTLISFTSSPLTIKGAASCEGGLGRVGYYLYSAAATMQNSSLVSFSSVEKGVFHEVQKQESEGGKAFFSFTLKSEDYPEGIHFIEVVAESGGGTSTSFLLAACNLPTFYTEARPKKLRQKAPLFVWCEGIKSVSCAAFYQDEVIENSFITYDKETLSIGENQLAFEASVNGKNYSTKYSYSNYLPLQVTIDKIAEDDYIAGTPLTIDKEDKKEVFCSIKTSEAPSNITYSIVNLEAESVKSIGGTVKASQGESEGVYNCLIPLTALPVGYYEVSVKVKSGQQEGEAKGSFYIRRSLSDAPLDNKRGLYLTESGMSHYDTASNSYVIVNKDAFYIYCNTHEIKSYGLVTPTEGVEIKQDGSLVTLNFTKDGIYKNLFIRVSDIFGASYTTPPLNFIVDSTSPVALLNTPSAGDWIKNSIRITGTCQDNSGIKEVLASIDKGATWKPLNLQGGGATGGVFSGSIDISALEDGAVELDVKVVDAAFNDVVLHSVLHKDTTPPEVTRLLPEADDVINGENLFYFLAHDDGYFKGASYIYEDSSATNKHSKQIGDTPSIQVLIGGEDLPLTSHLSFDFYDEADNHTYISTFDFTQDPNADLPIVEVHTPEDNVVITSSFNLTGVTYDDDGAATVYYRLDDGEYIKAPPSLPQEESVFGSKNKKDFNKSKKKEKNKKPLTYEEFDALYSEEADEIGEGSKTEGGEEDGNTEETVESSGGVREKTSSFSIPFDFETLTDNEHTIYLYAQDVNGVMGKVVERKIRVSKEEPAASLITPAITSVVHNSLTLKGVASDKNGIEKVLISLDNGNSFNLTEGMEEWQYTFDTRAVPNGINAVFFKVFDKYGVSALYSSMINVDNLPPEIVLDSPKESVTTKGLLFFSGYAFDNMAVDDIYIKLSSIEGALIPENYSKISFTTSNIIAKEVDLSLLPSGKYNIELVVQDRAKNTTSLTRNITLDKNKALAVVNTYYPFNGESKAGDFNIYGNIEADKKVEDISLYIDDAFITDTELTQTSYFKFNLTPAMLGEGEHRYYITCRLEGGDVIKSDIKTFSYSPTGPFITIDNFTYGDFAIERPFIRGHSGYYLTEEETALLSDKKTPKDVKEALTNKKVEKVEVSFDNGRSFKRVSKKEQWRLRIENEDITEGFHHLLVRAVMKDGSVVLDRSLIQIDHTAPVVRLIAPIPKGHYNEELNVNGLVSDNVGLKNVSLLLRKGDKAGYQVPAFIRGLYIDAKFWGATLFDVGVGLTFFDDNVKLQIQYGQFTQEQRDLFADNRMRYGGDAVFGLKILANVVRLPFGAAFGHDFDCLSATIAIGADFSIFNETASGDTQILSAILAQIEFPKIHIKKAPVFSTFGLYTEFSLWFIPTDVADGGDAGIDNLVFQVSEGIRINIF